MTKLVGLVKLVAELQAGETTEVEVARIERDEPAGPPFRPADFRQFLRSNKTRKSALTSQHVGTPLPQCEAAPRVAAGRRPNTVLVSGCSPLARRWVTD